MDSAGSKCCDEDACSGDVCSEGDIVGGLREGEKYELCDDERGAGEECGDAEGEECVDGDGRFEWNGGFGMEIGEDADAGCGSRRCIRRSTMIVAFFIDTLGSSGCKCSGIDTSSEGPTPLFGASNE